MIIQNHKKETKVFILDRLDRKIFVGSILGDTFRSYDMDNYHSISKSLGIDSTVLTTPTLRYRWIHFVYEGINYYTTRSYFYHHLKTYKLFNSRDQKFLELSQFGREKAERWEEYMDNLATAQYDIFKVLDEQRLTGEHNNEFLHEWQHAHNIIESYNDSQRVGKLIL